MTATRTHIAPADWKTVSRKSLVRKALGAIEAAGHAVSKADVARTGTVYITAESDDALMFVLRVGDHEGVAGKWSWDGRTDGYTTPDFDLTDSGQFAEMLENMNWALQS